MLRFGLEKRSEGIDGRRDLDIALAFIAGGLFEDACRLLEAGAAAHEEFRSSLLFLFNHAMADWGRRGTPSLERFELIRKRYRLAEDDVSSTRLDANFDQCMAVTFAVLGDKEDARSHLSEALRRIRKYLSSFSCWTYLSADKSAFERHCALIGTLIDDPSVVPLFISENRPSLKH
ncbi:MAG: hypothetical protein Q8K93_16355 [Reyranella sp.]|nr:hypothetical protein [Reyranella sp.]